MQRFGLLFHFQIYFFSLWLNQYMSFGISVLTFDNCNTDRSLFGIFWQQQDRRLWISLLFINYLFFFFLLHKVSHIAEGGEYEAQKYQNSTNV